MTILYFAWVRQKVGRGEEALSLPPGVRTVADLAEWLCARGAGYAEAFADSDRLRVAVNQEHKPFTTALAQDDEVAFFPPVTGG